LLLKQMQKLKYSFKIKLIDDKFVNLNKLNNKNINLINVNFNCNKTFDKISSKSNHYITQCFNLGLKLMKEHKGCALINGPISKKHFLKKKFPGITEYLASKTGHTGKEVMLIYNNNLSVSPITTHLQLKSIFKKITIKKITKVKPKFSTAGGTSDARFIRKISPCVEFGLVGKTAHKVDEMVSVADMKKLKKIYLNILENYFL